MDSKTLTDKMLTGIKQHPVLALLVLFGTILIVLSLFTGITMSLYQRDEALFPESNYQLKVVVPDAQVMLRWNGLVNSWRHPDRDLRFETELRLPVRFFNNGNKTAKIEALRLLSLWQKQQITWEALWTSHSFDVEPMAPIEPQIQQARERLLPFAVEDDEAGLDMTLDFAPLNYAALLRQGSYQNLLQARVAGTEGWVDLLQFEFSIADDFELSGSRVSGYQYWHHFPLDGQAKVE